MRTIIKIQSIEITIEDEAAAPAAITTATTQAIVEALQTAVQPMPASTVQPKARKARTVETVPAQPETPAPAVPLPQKGVVEPQATQPQPETPITPTVTFDVEQLQDAAFVAEHKAEIIQAAENGQIEPSKKRLNFEEFDKLVRAEMKRLAPSPGQMPSHSIWNELRNPSLPTLGAVISRYDCVDLKGLAKDLGMNPPLGRPGPVPAKATTNGAA